MSDNYSTLCGEVHSWLLLDFFAWRLKALGVRVERRESSHFVGGLYLNIEEGCHFTLERITMREYLAEADADTNEKLQAAAAIVSRALSQLKIRHRFELYDSEHNLVHYLHHLWPQNMGN